MGNIKEKYLFKFRVFILLIIKVKFLIIIYLKDHFVKKYK